MLQKTLARILLFGILFIQLTFTSLLSPITAAAEISPNEAFIVISAIQITGGTGHTQEDFIEFFNPTNTPYDLKGNRIVKRTAAAMTDTLIKSWTETTIIQPYHFYLWTNSSYISIPIIADVTTSGTLADNNGVALRKGDNDTGTIIDAVAWGKYGEWFC